MSIDPTSEIIQFDKEQGISSAFDLLFTAANVSTPVYFSFRLALAAIQFELFPALSLMCVFFSKENYSTRFLRIYISLARRGSII